MLELIKDYLKVKDVKFKENLNTSRISFIRIGGVTRLVIYPANIEELIYAYKICKSSQIPTKLLGRKSNVLFFDGVLDSIFIDTSEMKVAKFDGSRIEVECGASLPWLAAQAAERSLSGFEELSGIPGSLGGAIVGNAGAYGREMCELVDSVLVFDKVTETVLVLSSDKCCFSYRYSIFSDERYIVLSAVLKLTAGDSQTIRERMRDFRAKRMSTQPSLPSLGSTFKRPKVGYAGEMIDKCGLSGLTVGGAQISDKHAGFIVNLGCAKASDYVCLMELARERVHERYNVLLEPEIRIIK